MQRAHNTLILAAGRSKYQNQLGESISKFNFDLAGVELIDHVINTYNSGNTRLVLSQENLENIPNNTEVDFVIVGNTQGALISALLGLKDWDLTLPLFITPGDSMINPEKYRDFVTKCLLSESEISLVVFDSDNTNYSYIRTLDEKLVEVSEKKVISSQATAGIYYFKSAQVFINCAEWAILNNIRNQGLFFLAPALNYAVVIGLTPNLFQINEADYFRFSSYLESVDSGRKYVNANK